MIVSVLIVLTEKVEVEAMRLPAAIANGLEKIVPLPVSPVLISTVTPVLGAVFT
jgi:hypothetical protein